MIELKATQMTIASIQEEPISTELVDTTKECVEQLEKDLVGLQTSFTDFSVRITTMVEEKKQKKMKGTGGSRTSHSWVLGACWGQGLSTVGAKDKSMQSSEMDRG